MTIAIAGAMDRTARYNGTLYAPSGAPNAGVLSSGDLLRLKIASVPGAAPVLDLKSGVPSSNGSQISITYRGLSTPAPGTPATYFVEITEQDILASLAVGQWYVELDWVDSLDSYRTLLIDTGALTIAPSAGGTIGGP